VPPVLPDPDRHAGGVAVAPMRRWHLPEVHAIDVLVYPRPWSPSLWRHELTLGDSRFYVVADVAGSVVGHAGLMHVADEGHVTTVAVHPTWHGRQVATRLVLELCRHARRTATPALTLEVRVGNERAVSLYRRFGFAPAGVRKNYYAETNEDALVMWAHDVGSDGYGQRLDAIAAALPSAPPAMEHSDAAAGCADGDAGGAPC
jgi:ribosomal-protein-alanine N-acetyltransferase